MTLDYTIKGKDQISMYKYIEKMLTKLLSDMNGTSNKLATTQYLMGEELLEEKAQKFHQLVVKLCTYADILNLPSSTSTVVHSIGKQVELIPNDE